MLQYNTAKLDSHLICDDSELNRRILKRLLTDKFGVEVHEAENADSVFKQVESNGEYAIIWMDFGLGNDEMNGGEACKYLRERYGYTGTVIALTGYVDDETRRYCMQCGMNQFMSKPYSAKLIEEYTKRYARTI
jgi:CheY-like chemotaxis protein